jgi:hypothetical protein
MTEAVWLACDDTTPLLDFLRGGWHAFAAPQGGAVSPKPGGPRKHDAPRNCDALPG